IVSTLTGAIAGPAMATPDYWVRQTRQPVQFAAAVATLGELSTNVCVEVGAQAVLLSMARALLPNPALVLAGSLRKSEANERTLSAALAQLYVTGVPIDWEAVSSAATSQKIELPTYPFCRQRHWLLLPPSQVGQHVEHPLLGQHLTLAGSPEAHVFTVVHDVTRPTYLKDHQIEGAEVFPAAGYFEMALSAARTLGGDGAVEISQVTFEP